MKKGSYKESPSHLRSAESIEVLRRKKYPILFALLCMASVSVFLRTDLPKSTHVVHMADTIYLNGNVLGLNVLNDKTNIEAIEIQLTKGDIDVTDVILLESGQSVGNVITEIELKEGSYFCTLEYQIHGYYADIRKEYDVLLIVK